MVMDDPPEAQKVLASCGRPCPGVQVRIVDLDDQDVAPGGVGEIIVKSRSLMQEYWKQPHETENAIKNGWLYTGDLGYYDKTGNIYLVDRKKDMIVSGGENVYPREVEEVLYQHPAVEEAAVIGIPDPYWASVEAKEIMDFCKEKIARYKAPKSVAFVKTLPKNPQGKILKRTLRELYRGGN